MKPSQCSFGSGNAPTPFPMANLENGKRFQVKAQIPHAPQDPQPSAREQGRSPGLGDAIPSMFNTPTQ